MDRRQNNVSVKAVSPRHCCFNCRAGQSQGQCPLHCCWGTTRSERSPTFAAQLHLPAHDLFWADLRVQLHLPPLDLAWNPEFVNTECEQGVSGWTFVARWPSCLVAEPVLNSMVVSVYTVLWLFPTRAAGTPSCHVHWLLCASLPVPHHLNVYGSGGGRSILGGSVCRKRLERAGRKLIRYVVLTLRSLSVSLFMTQSVMFSNSYWPDGHRQPRLQAILTNVPFSVYIKFFLFYFLLILLYIYGVFFCFCFYCGVGAPGNIN